MLETSTTKPQNVPPGAAASPTNGSARAPQTAVQTYTNPIIHADYSDPDAIRVGDDFYLVASSFNCTPGLPILHSRDLVHWRLIGHALENLPGERFSDVQPGQGVWAPAIRHHAGKFWIFFPMPDEGIFVTTAEDIHGPWSEPHQLLAGKGIIDPCPLWDDDGQAYLALAYAESRAGIRNMLHIRPMTADGRAVTGEGRVVAQIAPELPALEGPKLHKRNGWYYISAPSGGVQWGWQVVFRSRSIYGPYEEKIVLAQRGTPVNGPHQGALVDTPPGPDGRQEWWFLHFQDAGLYGRIVHLQPVRWEDDWPLMGAEQDAAGVGKPVLEHALPRVGAGADTAAGADEYTLQASDEFGGPELGLQWQWQANHRPEWYSLSAAPGRLRLHAQFLRRMDFQKAPALMLQKFPALEFCAETSLELPADCINVHAGLIVIGEEFGALDVQRDADAYLVQLRLTPEVRGELRVAGPRVRLRVEVAAGGMCRFGVVEEQGGMYYIGPPLQARAGKWIGAKLGIYCQTPDMLAGNGFADFDYFRLNTLK